MRPRQRRRHVVAVAPPLDEAVRLPTPHDPFIHVGRILRVGPADQHEARADPVALQDAGRRDELMHALVALDAGGKHDNRLIGVLGRRFGARGELLKIDPAALDHDRNGRLDKAGIDEQRAVVGVLENRARIAVAKGQTIEPLDDRPLQAGAQALDEKQVTEAGDRVHDGGRAHQPAQRAAIQHRLHRHGMNEIGPQFAQEVAKRAYQRDFAAEPPASTVERNVVEVETMGADDLGVLLPVGRCDVHLVTQLPGGDAKRQTVRDKEQGLVHEKQDAPRLVGLMGAHHAPAANRPT